MLKTLTFSVSLAVALGACSLGMAGNHSILPSGQCEYPSAQAAPSSQCDSCGDVCGPVKRKHKLCDLFKHRQKCYTYEWVLKKKRCWNLFGHGGGGCGQSTCDTCGVTPSAQYPSAQGEMGSPQAAPAGQLAPAGQSVPASGGTVPPPPPAPTAANGGVLFLTPAGN